MNFLIYDFAFNSFHHSICSCDLIRNQSFSEIANIITIIHNHQLKLLWLKMENLSDIWKWVEMLKSIFIVYRFCKIHIFNLNSFNENVTCNLYTTNANESRSDEFIQNICIAFVAKLLFYILYVLILSWANNKINLRKVSFQFYALYAYCAFCHWASVLSIIQRCFVQLFEHRMHVKRWTQKPALKAGPVCVSEINDNRRISRKLEKFYIQKVLT